MTYTPLTLNRDFVPDCIVKLIDDRVSPLLHDVHWMLKHPYGSDSNEQPAFNLSAAHVLCTIIGGLSRFFCNETVGDKAAFVQVLQHYPSDERADALSGDEFGPELYDVYRCNLVHSLGLRTTQPSNRSRWMVDIFDETKKVTRHALSLNDEQLRDLNDVSARPSWLEPTLSRRDGVVRLNVDSLYWGVRQLIVVLASDKQRQAVAAEVLGRSYVVAKNCSATDSTSTPTTDQSGAVLSTVTSVSYGATSRAFESDDD